MAKFTKKSSVDRHIHEVHVMKRNYPCDKCHETFKTQKRLQYHVKMTHSKGVNLDDYIEEVKKIEYHPSEMQVKSVMDKHFERKCDLCDTELDTLTMAKSHYLAKHKNPNGYLRCCNYKLTHNSMFLEHIQWHIDSNIFRCRLCNTASKCRYNLLRHVKKHKIVSTKQFMCNICDQYFGTFSQHRIHMERKHSEMQPNSSPVETNPNENNGDLKNDIEIPIYADASCDLCPATTFNSFYEMQSHYLDIHSAAYGNVKCCESKFFTFPQFRDHIAWHNDPNIFRCGVCNKSLPNRRTLLRHNDLHANKFQCDVCNRSFGSTNHLKQHMNTHKARETLKRNIVCDVCHKKFRYEETMEKHRKMHTDNLRYDHICEFCAKEFKTIVELKNHILKKHSTETKQPEAKLQCDVCNGWYPKSSLKAHKIKHNSEPQKCNQCDKVSPNAQALEQHIRYTHNSEANFNCHLCEKSFKLPASLRDHIATHLNNKSHKCTYCDMTFVWRQNMYKHRKLHEEWLADKAEAPSNDKVMEIKKESDLCRLCYTQPVEYFDIFENATSMPTIVDTLKQYFDDEVNDSDILPKVICIECWDRIESFRKFSEEVIELREEYLQRLNSAVKDEHIEECVIPPEIHREIVCVDPLRAIKMLIEEEDENMELEESNLHYNLTDERGSPNDDEAYEEVFDSNKLPQCNESVRYTCDICQREYSMKKRLETHMLAVHVSKMKFPCNQCDESFGSRKRLEDHHHFKHSKELLSDYLEEIRKLECNPSEDQVKRIMEEFFEKKCDQCDAQLDSITMAKSHYLSEHGHPIGYLRCCETKIYNNKTVLEHVQCHIDPDIFRCRVCKLEHKHRKAFIKHLKGYEISTTELLECFICDQHFATSARCGRHMERKHSGIQTISSSVEPNSSDNNANDIEIPGYFDTTCDLCPATTFTSFKEMQSHYLDIHRSVGSVTCCHKKFSQLSHIRDHIALHNNPDIFRCEVCKESLPSRYRLKQHNDWHSNKYYCHTCKKSFKVGNLLRDHLEMHKYRNHEIQGNFICDVCDKRFPNRNNLNNHRKIHDLKHDQICEFCAKKFKTKTKLKLHQEKHLDVAPKTKPKFQCDICKGWYTSKGILKAHKMKHDAEPQKCSQCDKITPNPHALEQHIRRNHSDTILNCHLCEKSFKLPASLRDHIATHLNNKSHKCTYCDMTFVWRQNMYKHRKQMHEEEWLADKGKK
ncbi:zinc finger protein 729-like [Sitodiplosis mosellana]|uniref:zinc finger protein 729-like n=1 Tax=Sitodiplosis mosellana TaxID=263140 RepID=UPI0024441F9A|nr:zinc finger protein 729-like [Sitodiplosis mosellana]